MNDEDPIKYTDLISAQDLEFWDYLEKRDFKRLQKLQTAALGDGHFFDDSDTSDSEDEGVKNVNGKERDGLPIRGDDEEDEDFDHDGFMEQMLHDMHSAQDEELKNAEQIKQKLEEQMEKEKLE